MKSRAIILLLALAGILSACQKEIKLERKKNQRYGRRLQLAYPPQPFRILLPRNFH